MAGRWYRDSVNDHITPSLALAAAGGMSKAMQQLAKIPLDMDDRRQKQQELDAKSTAAGSRLSVAEANAAGKVRAAELGLTGKEAAAAAKIESAKIYGDSRKYSADQNKAADDYGNKVKSENNKNTNSTSERNSNRRSKRLVATYQGKAALEQMKRKSARLKEEAKRKEKGDFDLGDWDLDSLDALAKKKK